MEKPTGFSSLETAKNNGSKLLLGLFVKNHTLILDGKKAKIIELI